jgi:hypothetical protein
MKSNILIAVTCIAIGASVAWLAKPDPTTDAAKAEVEEKKTAPKGRITSSDSKQRETSERKIVKPQETPSITVIPSESEGSEQAREMGSRMEQMFRKRQQAKLDARISKLVSQLNLTSEQEAALRKAASERMGSFGEMMSGNFDPSKIGEMLNSDVIDDALADILTPEQQEELEAVEKREIANKVEAQALRALAKLSNLDLSQAQKDAAYDILYKDAESSVGNESPATGIVSMITEGFGIELDSDALGVATAIIPSADVIAGGGVEQDPQAMMNKAQETMNQRIDDKVEAMRPVLNDNQLDQYRKDLELKSGGIFGGLLNGFGAGETGGSTDGGE